MEVKTVSDRAKEYALYHECADCLKHDADKCRERTTCIDYHIAIIDFTAGFNEALRIITKKANA